MRPRIHGDSTKDSKYYKLYVCWLQMKDRCYNKKSKGYYYNGKKNIKVCDQWKVDYLSFKTWALKNGYWGTANGYEHRILDRIDKNKDYSPNNCKWIYAKNKYSNYKLSKEIAKEIRAIQKEKDLSSSEIANKYNISTTHARNIINNHCWKE